MNVDGFREHINLSGTLLIYFFAAAAAEIKKMLWLANLTFIKIVYASVFLHM